MDRKIEAFIKNYFAHFTLAGFVLLGTLVLALIGIFYGSLNTVQNNVFAGFGMPSSTSFESTEMHWHTGFPNDDGINLNESKNISIQELYAELQDNNSVIVGQCFDVIQTRDVAYINAKMRNLQRINSAEFSLLKCEDNSSVYTVELTSDDDKNLSYQKPHKLEPGSYKPVWSFDIADRSLLEFRTPRVDQITISFVDTSSVELNIYQSKGETQVESKSIQEFEISIKNGPSRLHNVEVIVDLDKINKELVEDAFPLYYSKLCSDQLIPVEYTTYAHQSSSDEGMAYLRSQATIYEDIANRENQVPSQVVQDRDSLKSFNQEEVSLYRTYENTQLPEEFCDDENYNPFPLRPLEIAETSPSLDGTLTQTFFDSIFQQIVWNSDSIEPYASHTIQFGLFVPDGYVNDKTFQAAVELQFGKNTNLPMKSITAVSEPISVISYSTPYIDLHDQYWYVAPGQTGYNTIFYLRNDERFDDVPHSDMENIKVQIFPGLGDCKPIYRGFEIQRLLNYDDYERNAVEKDQQPELVELIYEPEIGQPVTEDDFIEIYVHRWSWENYKNGFITNIDTAGAPTCVENSTISMDIIGSGTLDTVPTKNQTWRQIQSFSYGVQTEQCTYQDVASRDIIRVDQETFVPDQLYWDEWGIGYEINCLNTVDEYFLGSIAPGEYYVSTSWINQGFRRQTVDNDWFYVVMEIQPGTSFHGFNTNMSREIGGRYYPSRYPKFLTEDDKKIEIYKADTLDPTTLLPDNIDFDHTTPEVSGWNPVMTDMLPLNPDMDEDDPESSVYYELDKKQTILARIQNFQTGRDQDFFVPAFLMRVCDGVYCDAPETGADIYGNWNKSYALHDGVCEYCGETQFGRIRVEEVSWPTVYIESDYKQIDDQTPAQFKITPENHIMASARVEGNWIVDVSESADIIDFRASSANVVCEGECVLPDDCSVDDISITQASADSPYYIFGFRDNENCRLSRGWGKNILANACHDSYTEPYQFELSIGFKSDVDRSEHTGVKVRAYTDATNVKDVETWDPSRYDVDFELPFGPITIQEEAPQVLSAFEKRKLGKL